MVKKTAFLLFNLFVLMATGPLCVFAQKSTYKLESTHYTYKTYQFRGFAQTQTDSLLVGYGSSDNLPAFVLYNPETGYAKYQRMSVGSIGVVAFSKCIPIDKERVVLIGNSLVICYNYVTDTQEFVFNKMSASAISIFDAAYHDNYLFLFSKTFHDSYVAINQIDLKTGKVLQGINLFIDKNKLNETSHLFAAMNAKREFMIYSRVNDSQEKSLNVFTGKYSLVEGQQAVKIDFNEQPICISKDVASPFSMGGYVANNQFTLYDVRSKDDGRLELSIYQLSTDLKTAKLFKKVSIDACKDNLSYSQTRFDPTTKKLYFISQKYLEYSVDLKTGIKKNHVPIEVTYKVEYAMTYFQGIVTHKGTTFLVRLVDRISAKSTEAKYSHYFVVLE